MTMMPTPSPSPRRQQANDLVMRAIDTVEHDPLSPVALQRATALATIAQVLLIMEGLDNPPMMVSFEADDPPPPEDRGGTPPW